STIAGGHAYYSLAVLVQLATYALATVSLRGMTPRHVCGFADAAAHFVEMNAALLVGFVKYSRGAQGQTWLRTDRPARAASLAGKRLPSFAPTERKRPP